VCVFGRAIETNKTPPVLDYKEMKEELNSNAPDLKYTILVVSFKVSTNQLMNFYAISEARAKDTSPANIHAPTSL
jgi:hypothetical protein